MTRAAFTAIRRALDTRSPRRIDGPQTIQAAVALVLVPGDADVELLLIKRAERHDDPWSGQMALPGGRREPGDPSLIATAVRETEEETGIRLSPDTLLGELDDLHPRTRVLPPIVVRPFVFGLAHRPPVGPSPEVALYLWAPLAALRRSATVSNVLVRGIRRAEPSFLAGAHVVWGMTHRIIKPLLELTGE